MIDIHKVVSVGLGEEGKFLLLNMGTKHRNCLKNKSVPGLFCLRVEEPWMPGPQVEPWSQIYPENNVIMNIDLVFL